MKYEKQNSNLCDDVIVVITVSARTNWFSY